MSSLHQIADAIRNGSKAVVEDCRQSGDGWSIRLDVPNVRYAGYSSQKAARAELGTAKQLAAK